MPTMLYFDLEAIIINWNIQYLLFQFVIYKEDITLADDDLKHNLIFGKVMGDEESVKEILKKLEGPDLRARSIKEIKENVENEYIEKPGPLPIN